MRKALQAHDYDPCAGGCWRLRYSPAAWALAELTQLATRAERFRDGGIEQDIYTLDAAALTLALESSVPPLCQLLPSFDPGELVLMAAEVCALRGDLSPYDLEGLARGDQ